ncbi:VOC family protein [Azospirillum halopraeferens]|uniref:VOC family protein n=1 Tax=Azospirillum halopraeferens TaxID=34010 RepID=UPI000424CFFE|nr:VOC family protein [Azospirillum halopraeferens]
MTTPNVAVWFEIPATDFARAVRFYETVFGVRLVEERCPQSDVVMGIFPAADGAVKGCIIAGPGFTPGATGTVVYLNGGDDLTGPLERVWAAGGRVLVTKTLIDESIGYFAHFEDTEGNRVGLHSLR